MALFFGTDKGGWILNTIKFALLLFALSTTAMAAETECFCLKHDRDDFFRHSCETQQQGTSQVTHCRDDAGKPYKIDDMNGWTKIADGQGRCKPCKQKIDPRGGDIRSNNDQQSKDAPK